jgi:hypothetical protein
MYFDNRYFDHAPIYIKSIEVNEPNEKIFVQGYNLDENMIAELESYRNIAAVNNENVKREQHKMDRLEYYIINQKARQILEAFDRFPEENLFIITDVDMLMVNPMTDLREDMKTYDVGLVWVGHKKIMGGFVAVRRSKRTREFLEVWDGIMREGKYFYNKDQPALSRTFRHYQARLDFLLLTRQYLDHASSYDSYIWSAHKVKKFGSKKARKSQYKKKLQKMLNGYNIIL